MFTYGFYNSLNGDRKYDAIQMASIFDGIIEDGIYGNIYEQFMTIPGDGLQVIVKTGRAWFNHTWNLNDSWLPINLETPDIYRPRIDSVVIEINSNIDSRTNSIKIIKGEPETSPSAPTMQHSDGIDQYRLADITVSAGATSITDGDIAIKVGQDDTPFVVAPIKSVDISDLFKQWQADFTEFMDHVHAELEGDVATNLQRQIDERVKLVDKATDNDIKNGTPGKWVDAALAKSDLSGLTVGLEVGDIVYSTRDLETETNGKFLRCDQRVISQQNYQKLCQTDAIKTRLPKDLTIGTSATLDLKNWKVPTDYYFLNGHIHDGYIYTISGMNIGRIPINNPATTQNEILGTIPSGSATTWMIYYEYPYLYVLPFEANTSSAKNTVYKLSLLDKSMSSYTVSALERPSIVSTSGTFSLGASNILGYIKGPNFIDIIGWYAVAADKTLAMVTIRYSTNFTSRSHKWTVVELPKASLMQLRSRADLGVYDQKIPVDKNGSMYFILYDNSASDNNTSKVSMAYLYKKSLNDLAFTRCDKIGDICTTDLLIQYGMDARFIKIFTTENYINIFSLARTTYTSSTWNTGGIATIQLIYDLNEKLISSHIYLNDPEATKMVVGIRNKGALAYDGDDYLHFKVSGFHSLDGNNCYRMPDRVYMPTFEILNPATSEDTSGVNQRSLNCFMLDKHEYIKTNIGYDSTNTLIKFNYNANNNDPLFITRSNTNDTYGLYDTYYGFEKKFPLSGTIVSIINNDASIITNVYGNNIVKNLATLYGVVHTDKEYIFIYTTDYASYYIIPKSGNVLPFIPNAFIKALD